MITKFMIGQAGAHAEFGMLCQRLLPWAGQPEEPPLGVMACFLPPGHSSEPDCHDQDEVMFILGGDGSIDLAGETGEFTRGEMIVIPRNVPHVVQNTAGSQLSWISVYWPLREPGGG